MHAKRILVVDDEPIVGQAIKMTLRCDRYDVEVVTSPFDALDRLQDCSYDLIMTDYMMEGMTGLELADLVKKRSPAQTIMMISCSPPVLPRAVIDAVILKPFSVAELRSAVAQITERGTDLDSNQHQVLSVSPAHDEHFE